VEILRQNRPYLFTPLVHAPRATADFSKIIHQTRKLANKMGIKMPMYIIPDVEGNARVIKNKFEVHQELKESTFSHLFLVP
jgi:hypothetical protein